MIIPAFVKRRAAEYHFSIAVKKYCEVEDVSGCSMICDSRPSGHCRMMDCYIVAITDLRKDQRARSRKMTTEYHASELGGAWSAIAAAFSPTDGRKRNRDVFKKAKENILKKRADDKKREKESMTPDWGSRHLPSKNYGQMIIDMGSSVHATGDVSDAGGLYG